jgi:hypothetical protein
MSHGIDNMIFIFSVAELMFRMKIIIRVCACLRAMQALLNSLVWQVLQRWFMLISFFNFIF